MFQSQVRCVYRAISPVLCMLTLTLALTGCGGGSAPRAVPEPVTTIDWLMPTDAREVFEAAYSHFKDAAPTNPERSYTVDDHFVLSTAARTALAPRTVGLLEPTLPVSRTSSRSRRDRCRATYEAIPWNEARAVYGILDHGDLLDRGLTPSLKKGRIYFGAGYDHLDHNQYMLLLGRTTRRISSTSGTSWRGDALGMVKASAKPGVGTRRADHDLHPGGARRRPCVQPAPRRGFQKRRRRPGRAERHVQRQRRLRSRLRGACGIPASGSLPGLAGRGGVRDIRNAHLLRGLRGEEVIPSMNA